MSALNYRFQDFEMGQKPTTTDHFQLTLVKIVISIIHIEVGMAGMRLYANN